MVVICCALPAVCRADEATFDPFESRAFQYVQPAFDPFEIQQVVHLEEPHQQDPQPSMPSVKPLPAVKIKDPFEEAAWSAPLSESNYVAPAAAEKPAVTPTADAPKAEVARFEVTTIPVASVPQLPHSRTAQLELPPPRDQQPEDAEGYAKSAQDWRPKPLDELTINISQPSGVTPRDYAADQPQGHWVCDPTVTRCWSTLGYQWAATCLCYQPLYFEEINLERYGYGCCRWLQPAASAAHFFGTVPILPYCMAVNCPGECNYVLGKYRPGSCAPWRTQCPGPNCVGGLAEAGTVVGLVLLIP